MDSGLSRHVIKRALLGSAIGFFIGWMFVAYWFGGTILSLLFYCPIPIVFKNNTNMMTFIHQAAGLLLGAFAGLLSAFVPHSRFGQIFMLDKDTVIVDVRERDEYEAGHIPNSISIPLAEIGDIDLSFLKDKKVIVYCTSGIRSAKAAKMVRKRGIHGVIDFNGGIKVWLKNGGRLDFKLDNYTGGTYA